jgi:triacylglycerol lipase
MDIKRSAPIIVFSHGIFGFHRFQVGPLKVDYFRGVEEALQRMGYSVCFPAVPATSTIVERATVLAARLAELASDNIYLIAHSMGGLDARYLIHHLDPEHRIRCLVTIGTPHLGTPLANWLLETDGPVQWIGRYFGKTGVEELTPQACARFNEKIPDRDDVRYVSYAGARPASEMPRLFRAWTRMLQAERGDNDSQVPVSAATWGEFRGTVRAAHTELVGWSLGLPDPGIERPFNHIQFYLDIAGQLTAVDANLAPAHQCK